MASRPKELWQVAYFLSKYSTSTPPAELNTKRWKEAYYIFYNSLGAGKKASEFEHSLKNCRDAFDSYVNTFRTGWRDKNNRPAILPQLAKGVLDEYSRLTRNAIWTEIVHSMVTKNKRLNEQPRHINNCTRNPVWKREELILALDLYFKLDAGQMHGSHPKVKELSEGLRELNIYRMNPLAKNFRSPGSVSLKLANFKRCDENRSSKGMKHGGKSDRELWNEFKKHRNKLTKEADLIRQLYLKPQSDKKSIVADLKVNYKSEFLFQYHKNRETDPLVIKVKKEKVLAETEKLKCEVCGFDPIGFYGEIGNDLMEIHYNKELKNEPGLESSEINDFVIVCSNCHKALDKNFGLLNAADLKKIVRKK